MTTDLSKFLADPKPGITLDELAKELNELARIRESTRLAFCKRLAVVYLMIVGHAPTKGGTGNGGKKFHEWCSAKIRSGNGKQYSAHYLNTSVRAGISKNPAGFLRRLNDSSNRVAVETRSFRDAVVRAVTAETPPKVIPMTKLKAQGMPTDVAREVNVLMTAWEQASSQARSQFMYMITGKRIAA
jgi:hypothetical protein